MLMFPEGERNFGGEEVRDSMEYAKREGRPQLRNLLLPRTKGWLGGMEGLKEGDLGEGERRQRRDSEGTATGIDISLFACTKANPPIYFLVLPPFR